MQPQLTSAINYVWTLVRNGANWLTWYMIKWYLANMGIQHLGISPRHRVIFYLHVCVTLNVKWHHQSFASVTGWGVNEGRWPPLEGRCGSRRLLCCIEAISWIQCQCTHRECWNYASQRRTSTPATLSCFLHACGGKNVLLHFEVKEICTVRSPVECLRIILIFSYCRCPA